MYHRSDETEAVIQIAADYYIAMVEGDGDTLRRVFHPRATVIGHVDGALEYTDLEEFIASTPDAKAGDGPFDYKVENLVIVDDTAVVSVGGYSYGRWFTDHLSMVKIEGRWQIVCKTFRCFPEGHRVAPPH